MPDLKVQRVLRVSKVCRVRLVTLDHRVLKVLRVSKVFKVR